MHTPSGRGVNLLKATVSVMRFQQVKGEGILTGGREVSMLGELGNLAHKQLKFRKH
jgi:hypothetical protein